MADRLVLRSSSLLIGLTVCGIVLTGLVGFTHRDTWAVGPGALAGGSVLASILAVLVWSSRRADDGLRHGALALGLGCGALWVLEIAVNNVLAPPLPGRDRFDDAIWAVVSVAILLGAARAAHRTTRIRAGLGFGAWAGLASGLVACVTALSFVVFGLDLLAADPLAREEWLLRGATSGAAALTDYVAAETFAGAFGHLLLIGLLISTALGGIGGVVGAVVERVASACQRAAPPAGRRGR